MTIRQQQGWKQALVVLSAVVLAVALTGCTAQEDGGGQDAASTPAATPGGPEAAPLAAAAAGLIPNLVEQVEPSVVAVVTDRGEGSGVVWNDQGIVVTNNHVIEGARQIEVEFQDGERAAATVRAADPSNDLAVLETERQGLSPAEFAETLPRVGDLAIAIGNPLGFENSVTAGIVSGLGRTLPGTAQSANQALFDLIQTDAAISPGNSGGALVGADGKVIGINVAYLPPQQVGAVSIGFAIPSTRVTDVVGQLLEDGTVEHAYLGVEPRNVTAALAQQFGLPVDHGALVTAVGEGTPAASALQPGDIIVAVGGEEVRTTGDLLAAIRGHSPGDELELRIYRDGSEQTVSVTLADRPASPQPQPR